MVPNLGATVGSAFSLIDVFSQINVLAVLDSFWYLLVAGCFRLRSSLAFTIVVRANVWAMIILFVVQPSWYIRKPPLGSLINLRFVSLFGS